MKKYSFFALFGSLLFLASCSNDFDVSAPWKDIPIVYGLLNIDDPVHYIRVEKAFLDPNASALDIARIADSLYYDNATVEFEKLNTGERFMLERVDGNLIGLPRDSGIFATSPNWLYRIDDSVLQLEGNDSIRLIVNRGNGLPEVTATTAILDTSILRPANVITRTMGFAYNLETDIEWSSPPDARIFDVTLYLHYAEFNTDNPSVIVEKTFEWVWARGLRKAVPESSYTVSKLGREFYQVLQQNLESNPKIRRIIQTLEIEIIAGAESLEKYINVGQANTGITSSQDLPVYTNLSEGRGIFSSINIRRNTGIQLRPEARDSLRNGIYTKDLNFQ